MMNLPDFIFSVVMGFLMSSSITLAITLVRIGPADSFFAAWFGIWAIAYPVAIICVLIYKPFATHVTKRIMKKLKGTM
jgi:hypothetical protein